MAKFFEYSRELMMSAKERWLGEDYWIPKAPDEIVEVPRNQIGSHQCVLNEEPFAILCGKYGDSKTPVYHVIISWNKEVSRKELDEIARQDLPDDESLKKALKKVHDSPEDTAVIPDVIQKYNETTTEIDKQETAGKGKGNASMPQAAYAILKSFCDKKLSIFRSSDYHETSEVYQSCLRCKMLFDRQDNLKDMRTLLAKIRAHPLWDEIHMACRLNYIWYFTTVSKDKPVAKLLNVPCSPEGLFPLSLAIKFGHVDLVKTILQLGADIAKTDVSGANALHCAAEFGNAQIVDVLCSTPNFEIALNSLNKDGCTPLFWAVRCGNPFIVTALLRHGAELNAQCKGRTPLYEAMQQTSGKTIEVVQLLVDRCPSILNEKDEATGNSAIHFAAGKHALHSLLAVATPLELLDINERNKSGQTALHLFTHRGDLGGVITLAAYNADINAKDDQGLTPLHVAVSRADIDIIKALLVLGAKVDAETVSCDSPRHIAARLNQKLKKSIVECLSECGAQRCPPNKVGCASNCIDSKGLAAYMNLKHQDSSSNISTSSSSSVCDIPENTELSAATADLHTFMQQDCIDSVMNLLKMQTETDCVKSEESQKQMVSVLALDGGGIKGLMLLQVLAALQNYLPRPVASYFDWIGGTSTGSFVAACLTIGFDLHRCQSIYLKLKDQLFEGWARPYSASNLEAFIKKEIGGSLTMKDLTDHKIMIPTVQADQYPVKLVLFRSYQLPCLDNQENVNLGYDNPEDTFLWRALRCSSAAPTFFQSVDGKYVDGGLVSNNPTMELLTEIQTWNAVMRKKKEPVSGQLRIGSVLSIGCGAVPYQTVDTLDFGNPYSAAVAMRNLGYIMVDQVTQTEGATVERARAWCHSQQVPYFRLTTPLDKVVAMDTKDDKEIVNFMWLTLMYTKKMDHQIQQIANLLTSLKPCP